MKRLKKTLRLLVLLFFILLASIGIGIMGNIFSNNRERYHDKEIRIELNEKREDEAEQNMNKDVE